MTKYAVFGAGMMGRVIAKDLIDSEPQANVALFDQSDELLRDASKWIGSDRLRCEQLDATDRDRSTQALASHDVAVAALPHRLSLPIVEAAIDAGTSLVDLVGEAPEKRRALDGAARDASVVVIPGCGVAPGISNFCVGRGMELLDETENAVIYVGGIPRRPRPPLFYETVFLLESVLGAYRRPAKIRRGGKTVEVAPLSGIEELDFPEPIGRLQAFYTDGLGSLPVTVGEKIKGDLYEKTLRYPGHAEAVGVLEGCGLLEKTPVDVSGVSVAPVAVLQRVLEEKLELGPEGDILVMRVRVEGARIAHEFDLIDYFDKKSGNTAMARTTGFTASAAARRIATGEIEDVGVLFPEEIFLGSRFDSIIAELGEKGIVITHREREIPQHRA